MQRHEPAELHVLSDSNSPAPKVICLVGLGGGSEKLLGWNFREDLRDTMFFSQIIIQLSNYEYIMIYNFMEFL
jgi:hypothetical protein